MTLSFKKRNFLPSFRKTVGKTWQTIGKTTEKLEDNYRTTIGKTWEKDEKSMGTAWETIGTT